MQDSQFFQNILSVFKANPENGENERASFEVVGETGNEFVYLS
jgi:hypothetical protein